MSAAYISRPFGSTNKTPPIGSFCFSKLPTDFNGTADEDDEDDECTTGTANDEDDDDDEEADNGGS